MTTGLLLGSLISLVPTLGRSRLLRLRHSVYEGYGTSSRLGNRPSGPSSRLLRPQRIFYLPTKAYKRSYDLAIDSKVSKETPMTPNRVIPPCLQFPPIPNAADSIPNRKGAFIYTHISLVLLRLLAPGHYTPPVEQEFQEGPGTLQPSWLARDRRLGLPILLQPSERSVHFSPALPIVTNYPIINHYSRKFPISHPTPSQRQNGACGG